MPSGPLSTNMLTAWGRCHVMHILLVDHRDAGEGISTHAVLDKFLCQMAAIFLNYSSNTVPVAYPALLCLLPMSMPTFFPHKG